MPEVDREGERYLADRPQQAPGFFLKGSHQLDWGMKNRLARSTMGFGDSAGTIKRKIPRVQNNASHDGNSGRIERSMRSSPVVGP